MNRLKNEKSPYLLQHADNPVNWHTWSEEAFELAEKEDKPLFISIGYSTCHWCHIMNSECFQDEEVAELINDAFIPVKVDREERRDVDNFYMLSCQIINNSGGWPLTVFATPDKKPFFADSYIPKHSQGRRPGLMELIPHIKKLWLEKKDTILKAARQIFSIMEKVDSASMKRGKLLDSEYLDYCYESLYNIFDLKYGGFSKAPKFPVTHNIKFLIKYGTVYNNEKALGIALKTLENIRLGGIYDHVGGGIHRYSTDESWLIPHFEKTLYDQALITDSFLLAFEATENFFYKDSAEDTLYYTINNLLSESGGFFSGEDALSEFYLFSSEELLKVCGNNVENIFNFSSEGNFYEEKTGKPTGKNVLSLKSKDIIGEFKEIKNKLFSLRKKRSKPAKDNKILLDWNALTATALYKAYKVYDNKYFLKVADSTVEFITNKMMRGDCLFHRIIDDSVDINGFIDDYIFFIETLLTSFEYTDNTEHFKLALKLTEIIIENFWDKENGAFYFTDKNMKNVVLRKKEFLDSAVPSANSKSLFIFCKLYSFTGNKKYIELAEDIIKVYSNFVDKSPVAFTEFFYGLLYFTELRNQ